MKHSLLKCKPSLLFCFILGLILFLSPTIQAQESPVIKISGEKSTINQELSSLNDEVPTFTSLLFDVQPTAYIELAKISNTTGGNRPVSKTVLDSPSSISALAQKDPKLQKTQLLVINVEDQNELSSSIDISALQNTSRLKCIYVICEFNCSENDIKSFITKAYGKPIFYSISTPQ